jgi:hypothetical protein
MLELIEPDPSAAAVVAKILARQAAALHVVFMRGFVDVLSNRDRSLRDVSRALKAQNQCRIALRLMLALRALEQSQKNSRNRTNRLLKEKIPHDDQALGKAAPNVHLCQAEAPPQRIGLVAPKLRSSEGGVVTGAPRQASGADPILATVEKIDRSANRRRQDPLHLECAQTRAQKPRLYRTEARRATASSRLRRDNRPRQAPPPHALSHQGIGRSLNLTSHTTRGASGLPCRSSDFVAPKLARAKAEGAKAGGGILSSDHEPSQEARPAASSPAVA